MELQHVAERAPEAALASEAEADRPRGIRKGLRKSFRDHSATNNSFLDCAWNCVVGGRIWDQGSGTRDLASVLWDLGFGRGDEGVLRRVRRGSGGGLPVAAAQAGRAIRVRPRRIFVTFYISF